MSKNETDVISLLKYGNPKQFFIDLTIAIVTSPYIQEKTKLNILNRLVNGYEKLKED